MTLRSSISLTSCVFACVLTIFSTVEPCFAQQRGARQRGSQQRNAQQRDNNRATAALPDSVSEQIKFRSIGPANMGGRITAIAVYEADPSTWWAATASGGLLKTTNNGNDFEHQFDDQATVSIGDVQVAQSNPDIVWVGTGESNPRNSVSWGDGVYKSEDGGKTWTNMGLKKIFQTGAIAIHPTNPDVVFVGALGRLWGPNPERGLFKTTDGGKNWKKVLFVDDQTGVVDVQLNPKNPDEMLVATYQRKRDGFDGNDPEVRFGEGAGIYKSTDGGETFEQVTEGLPTVKLGRIGLDYFESDPNFVYAVVESEKIGSEPDNFPFLGVRGEDAEAGARITRVTENTAASEAGLKTDDIVISVGTQVVANYQDMLKEIYRFRAGDGVKLTLVRDGKMVDVELKLDEKREGQRGSYFTGTLGGQGENRQNQQGEDGFQYGGVYRSEDGGSTWTRINSLNPRPMYYSNIQVDPVDRNNIYLCGTSLWKSSDGGETFTGDGGTDGIHVDHHALWIDKRDSRHMILGNDGGIYVTWDRMEHWDHHNHVAIGQFYHASVDSRLNYNVYGGLQDNGSWGGPSRNSQEGIINSDWFRVGGGDGFVTRSDPNDPDQIYFESQNGGMGRIHLETGERGFIRPRGRGIRFNWKTPYVLSPHNTNIHLSAGNFVFRSFSKGDNTQPISPEITNTDQGAGSAIAESPRQAGVIYVGTTDGAVWMTRDGGKQWRPLFYQPEEKKTEEKDEEQQADSGETESEQAEGKKVESDEPGESAAGETEADTEKPDTEEPADNPEAMADPVSGDWNAKLISDQIPAERGSFSMNLKLDGNKISGFFDGRGGKRDITNGSFNAETGEFEILIEAGRVARKLTGKIENGLMKGTMAIGSGRLEIPFTATPGGGEQGKTDAESGKDGDGGRLSSLNLSSVPLTIDGLLAGRVAFVNDDPISGTWEGVLENENLPDGRLEFSMALKLDQENRITGTIESAQGVLKIFDGVYNPETKRALFNADSDEGLEVEVAGTVKDENMSGTIYVVEPNFEMEFGVKRTKRAEAEKPDAEKPEAGEVKPEKPAKEPAEKEAESKEQTQEPEQKPEARPAGRRPEGRRGMRGGNRPDQPSRRGGEGGGERGQRGGERQEPAEETAPSTPQKTDDPIVGTWKGTLTSPRGEREMSLVLKKSDDQKISGSYEFGQGEQDLTSAKYDPETKQLNLVAETDRFNVEFRGKVEGNRYKGTMDFGGGRFTMDFDLKRGAAETGGSADEKESEFVILDAPEGEQSLKSLLPGPRWVSSIEASRFKEGRCYITFDGHRSNDDAPYAFVTEDYGQTWKSLTRNLPATAGSVRVLREDIENENLLLLGCEFSAWWSIDRGETWTRIKGLPTVAVHEFDFHKERQELLVATHGRSLWIADISILRQVSKSTLAESMHLYEPKTVYLDSNRGPERGDSGTRRFVGENPDDGVTLGYSLGDNARQVSLKVFDVRGGEVHSFDELSNRKGLHLVEWDLRRDGGGGGGRRRFGATLPAGTYRLELRVDDDLRIEVLTIE